jgi:glucosamine-6-phosphate deaminase
MFLILSKGYAELSRRAATIVSDAIRKQPDLRLGLATGTTPLGMYRELARMHREEHLDFSRVVTFNLDEYLGLAADHPQSAHRFMQSSFFGHVNIAPENIHIPDGTAPGDLDEYCARYEGTIQMAGGIDLQILGIGRNGHIGFNEPSSSLASRTRIKTLTRQTLEDNRRLFQEGEAMPEAAITMGIGTILDARKILLVASGASKAQALARAIEGPVTASVTASALQLHRDVTILADEEAAAELREKDYYRRDFEVDSRLRRGAK